jgi:cell wall-associated NlpC family hydrolase
MSGSHSHYKGKHRAYNPRVLPALGGLGIAGAVGTAGMLIVTGASADTPVNWDSIAACESGGNWATNTGNGFYGGLQWTQATWNANGGTGNPANASRTQQIAVANNLITDQGIDQGLANWPTCGKHATSAAPAVQASSAGPKHAAPTQIQSSANVAPALSIYTGPTTDYVVTEGDILAQIARAQQVPGGWQQIAAANRDALPDPDQLQVGQQLKLPVPAEPVVPLGLPQPVKFSSPAPALKAFTASAAPATVTAQGTSGGVAARAVAAALSFRGVPYVYGGNSRSGIDCSGLIVAAYRAAGISMPRTAAAQAAMGKTVKLADVRAGDLLFYDYGDGISHVVLAVDSGHIVEASQPGKPVATRAIYTGYLVAIRRLT